MGVKVLLELPVLQ